MRDPYDWDQAVLREAIGRDLSPAQRLELAMTEAAGVLQRAGARHGQLQAVSGDLELILTFSTEDLRVAIR